MGLAVFKKWGWLRPHRKGFRQEQLLKRLMVSLRDTDPLLRATAVRTLGSLKDPQVITLLTEALADDDVRVRYGVVQALGQLGDEQGVDALITALTDADQHVRTKAAEALGKIGTKALVPLILALATGPKAVRRGAVRALGEIGDATAVQTLVCVLKDRDLRSSVAQELERIGMFAVPFLLAAFKEDDPELRRITKGILLNIGSAAKDRTLVVESVLGVLKERDERVQREISDVVHRFGPATIELLIKHLRNPDAYIRRWALSVLQRFRWQPRNDEETVSYLWASAQWEALIAMGPLALEPLLVAVRQEDVVVRRKAATALGAIGDRSAVEVLLTALHDEDLEVRRCAVEALGQLGDERAVAPLIALWEERAAPGQQERQDMTEAYQQLHAAVATALVQIGPATLPLLRTMQDHNSYVRQWVTTVLAQLNQETQDQGEERLALPCSPRGLTLQPVPPAPSAVEQPAILVLEDDPVTQTFLRRLLNTHGYAVTVAGDGVEAIVQLSQKVFALILSDIHLPVLDGLKLLEMLRQKELTTPVIFLTAETSEASKRTALALGATGYLPKPLDPEQVLECVSKALAKRPSAAKDKTELPA